MGKELYMFAQLDDKYTGSALDTKITIDGITIANKTSRTVIGDSNAAIKYLLVIDQSGSMNQYVNRVNAFVDALADHERANAVFTIAGFGEDFKIISEGMTDKEAVKTAIAGLSYQEPWTDPYHAVVQALNYVDTVSRTGGEVLNIIVVSDGEVDLGIPDAEQAQKAERERAAAAKNKIRKSPEALIHTLGVTDWEELCLDTFEAGRGDNAVIQDENDAASYGEKIANYIDSLYCLNFSLNKDVGKKRFAVEVQMTGTDSAGTPSIINTTFEKIPNLTNYIVEESEENVFKIIGSAEERNKKHSKELETDKDADDKNGEKDDEDSGAQGTFYFNDDSAEKQTCPQLNTRFIVFVIAIAVCLVFIILLACLFTKKKKQETDHRSASADADGIQIWLEPIFGEMKRPKGKFSISGSMTIGFSSKADIVIKAEGVCDVHAKLFLSNGVIYIWDMSQSSGVFMSGMRLQAPNRLEDGDEITIGAARIVVRVLS